MKGMTVLNKQPHSSLAGGVAIEEHTARDVCRKHTMMLGQWLSVGRRSCFLYSQRLAEIRSTIVHDIFKLVPSKSSGSLISPRVRRGPVGVLDLLKRRTPVQLKRFVPVSSLYPKHSLVAPVSHHHFDGSSVRGSMTPTLRPPIDGE
ncbi:hypothetical protein CEXT_788341 [Caerostris extrusa]|uniref:Uncharacterized protein n=1 Tax=Caerostris extrusa TaxID=172846 RepID=A0AAV4UBK1_CAEEX|nr:hypothetical protein CEXT_788341 [Caerostris extrusa]